MIKKIQDLIKKKETIPYIITENQITGLIYGLAIGESIGIQVKNKTKEQLTTFPVTEMPGYGDYPFAGGTWANFTKNLIRFHELYITKPNEYNMQITEQNNDTTFIINLILAIYYYTQFKFFVTKINSQQIIDFILLTEFVINWNKKNEKKAALKSTLNNSRIRIKEMNYNTICLPDKNDLIRLFFIEQKLDTDTPLLSNELKICLKAMIQNNNFRNTLLFAINSGINTTFTGSLVGALAGFHYNITDIPDKWIQQLNQKILLNNLCNNVINHIHNK